MKYWVQAKAPAGNWYDMLGTNDKDAAIRYAKHAIDVEKYTSIRIVERIDTPIWPV